MKASLSIVGDSLTPTLVAALFIFLSTLETFEASSVMACQLGLLGHGTSAPTSVRRNLQPDDAEPGSRVSSLCELFQ